MINHRPPLIRFCQLALLLSFCFYLTLGALATTWQDGVGRTVVLTTPPQKIVSLVPSVTEIIYAFGAEAHLIGVSDACTYPEDAKSKSQMGRYSEPNLEAIVAARPDIVFVAADMHRRTFVERLEKLGLTVFVVYPRSVQAVIDDVALLGEVIGFTVAGQNLALELQNRLDAVVAKLPLERPKVLLVIMTQPLIVAGQNTMSHDLLSLAGAINAVPSDGGSYPTWGVEGLLTNNPDAIIIAPPPNDGRMANFFEQWPQLKAVRNGAIYSVNPDWIHRPGPRLISGIEAIFKALHGE